VSGAVAVVILAGGEGRRIGGDKPLKMVGGERLIDRALRHARAWSDSVAVAVREAAQAGGIDALLIRDAEVPGPLGGLISALRFATERKCELLLTIPADMPFLPPDLLERLAGALGEYRCALASSGGHLHPVCGLWRSALVVEAEAYARSGRRSLRGLGEIVGFAAVEWPVQPDSFFNVNTSDQLAEAARRCG
jgi:molybdopterin-guanine dinucleotide biosynthesis protein A